jgi:hypothetical protein
VPPEAGISQIVLLAPGSATKTSPPAAAMPEGFTRGAPEARVVKDPPPVPMLSTDGLVVPAKPESAR